MPLSKEDKAEIAGIISNKPNIFDGNITEWLFRGLLALLLFLGNNIRVEQAKQGSDLTDVKSDISKILIDKQYFEKDLETFRNILEKPRFTKEDFDQQISPLYKQLNLNTSELNDRNSFMSDTEKRITKLEYQIIELIEYKKN